LAAVNVLEAIQRSTDYLGKKGVESARLNAELLLSHVLEIPRMKLYLDFERTLDQGQTDALRELVVRRGKREPLQQITGTASFCGLELRVTRDVLTPRPETEVLAETASKTLTAAAQPDPLRILDFGTGSGCLAICLAVKHPSAGIVALDASAAALEVARTNAKRHKVDDRMEFVLSNGFARLDPGLKFNLIVANPPYIPTGDIVHLQLEVRDYEPVSALDGGADGLNFYRQLAAEAGSRLVRGAHMVLEFGDGQAEAITGIFLAENWIVEPPIADYTGRPRILAARKTAQPHRT